MAPSERGRGNCTYTISIRVSVSALATGLTANRLQLELRGDDGSGEGNLECGQNS